MSFLDRDKYGMYRETGKKGPGPELMGADTLLGEDVVNSRDEDLGDIKEIMIDMRTGQIAYAVLSFGGVLGVGEKLFAVPWQALELDTVNKRFVLDVDKERLKSAPGFDQDAWPDMSDVAYVEEIHTFYGTDPSRMSSTGSMGSMGTNIPRDGMVGGAARGAGASSMGAGHAGGSAGMGTSGGAGSSASSGAGGGGGMSGGAGSGGGAAGTAGSSGVTGKPPKSGPSS